MNEASLTQGGGHEHPRVPPHDRERRRAAHVRAPDRRRPATGSRSRTSSSPGSGPRCTSTIARSEGLTVAKGGSAGSASARRRSSRRPGRAWRSRGRGPPILERGRGQPSLHGLHPAGRQHRVLPGGGLRLAKARAAAGGRTLRGGVPDAAVPERVRHDRDPRAGPALRLPRRGSGGQGARPLPQVRRRARGGDGLSGHPSAARRPAATTEPLRDSVVARGARSALGVTESSPC